ncbi:large conductance mechanosensitive channel protein MscL [Kitasatospora sp. NA04385]|uniref:large conductance mechanosensitive channel protein MscL n=1 Tax=Kitasatospora sp. NA04385 TaxID=2742135 RepID=UPI001590F51D|nr:large conductance mechanosensitive channel protein MscL [Kitasatospora sp. NA04385]QKW17872.1 large conductance mechanosensitive channel protein MscL [Kitasatospora sp. NA04385]
MKGFRGFVLRGNVVDLAVGVVIGAAFSGVVTALVRAFLTPLVGLATGAVGDFSRRTVSIHHVEFPYGGFIDAVITLLLTALVLYFVVVLPFNKLHERFAPHQDVQAPKRDCPECLSAIPARAIRCAFCTAELAPMPDLP